MPPKKELWKDGQELLMDFAVGNMAVFLFASAFIPTKWIDIDSSYSAIHAFFDSAGYFILMGFGAIFASALIFLAFVFISAAGNKIREDEKVIEIILTILWAIIIIVRSIIIAV